MIFSRFFPLAVAKMEPLRLSVFSIELQEFYSSIEVEDGGGLEQSKTKAEVSLSWWSNTSKTIVYFGSNVVGASSSHGGES